jgi:hypothetical protein
MIIPHTIHMGKKFDGMYYKHQKCGHTVSLIAGASSNDHAFIQVITNERSFYFRYPPRKYKPGKVIAIGSNTFGEDGIKVRIEENDISICGEIKYTGHTPLSYDIMGPLKYLPMECKHKITSLYHKLDGYLTIDGKTIDFTGGTGYIEGDYGTSFPKSYAWVQCSDFPEKTSIVASAADIPFAGTRFWGCFGVVYHGGAQYRFATYLGAKILVYNESRLILKQGKSRLDIEIEEGKGHKLIAPVKGEMVRQIGERIVCGARFRLIKNGKVLFDGHSKNASFEFVEDKTI